MLEGRGPDLNPCRRGLCALKAVALTTRPPPDQRYEIAVGEKPSDDEGFHSENRTISGNKEARFI